MIGALRGGGFFEISRVNDKLKLSMKVYIGTSHQTVNIPSKWGTHQITRCDEASKKPKSEFWHFQISLSIARPCPVRRPR